MSKYIRDKKYIIDQEKSLDFEGRMIKNATLYRCKFEGETPGGGLTPEQEEKLNGIEAGAEVNTIEEITVNGTPVAPDEQTRTVNITIPAAQIQSDWAQDDATQKDFIKNKPTIQNISTVNVNVDDTSGTPEGTGSVVENTLTLSFTGLKGATGATGADGADGADGVTPAFSIGTVTTGAAGSSAAATITGTAAAPALNLTIPKGDTGATGVGFASVASQEDGTVVITLTNGDSITIDLNHDHTAYPKYVLCADEAEYTAITTKDSATLYLIPE